MPGEAHFVETLREDLERFNDFFIEKACQSLLAATWNGHMYFSERFLHKTFCGHCAGCRR